MSDTYPALQAALTKTRFEAEEVVRKIEWWSREKEWLLQGGHNHDASNAAMHIERIWALFLEKEALITHYQLVLSMYIPPVDVSCLY